MQQGRHPRKKRTEENKLMTSGARNGKKERSMKKMSVPHGQFYPLPSDATILSVVRKECGGP